MTAALRALAAGQVTAADHIIALAEQHSGREANRDSRLLEDLDLDSLDRIEFALVLEQHFNIEIPDDDVDNPELGTVAGLIDYVERKLLAKTIEPTRGA